MMSRRTHEDHLAARRAELERKVTEPLPLEYSYQAIWWEEDNEYVGLCDQLPGLSWMDTSKSKALEGIKKLVADILVDLENDNDSNVREGT